MQLWLVLSKTQKSLPETFLLNSTRDSTCCCGPKRKQKSSSLSSSASRNKNQHNSKSFAFLLSSVKYLCSHHVNGTWNQGIARTGPWKNVCLYSQTKDKTWWWINTEWTRETEKSECLLSCVRIKALSLCPFPLSHKTKLFCLFDLLFHNRLSYVVIRTHTLAQNVDWALSFILPIRSRAN